MTSRSLALLSGEGTTVPAAEARAVFRTYDPDSRFETPEERVLLAETAADPFTVGARIAFSRRVGTMVNSPAEAAGLLAGKRVRFRSFDLRPGLPPLHPESYLGEAHASVDLRNPEVELTLVRGKQDYLAVTRPLLMRQAWATRRPRARAFFHPSAIFPKLSRALVNLSRCKEADVFLDPFSGTGSLAIEAAIVGASVVAVDRSKEMAEGSLRNMKRFGQQWTGVVRGDSSIPPIRAVDAIATDVPYGRASSTHGLSQGDVVTEALRTLPPLLKSGSVLVLMHPQTSAVEGNAEVAVEEEHHLYIHKLLTRTISVLRRR